MKNILKIAALALGLSSCASLHTVSVTDMPAKRSSVVTASTDKFVFLGLSFDNDFVNGLTADLASQCKGGVVSGILTKHETYFYFIGHSIKVKATGYCNKGGKRKAKKG